MLRSRQVVDTPLITRIITTTVLVVLSGNHRGMGGMRVMPLTLSNTLHQHNNNNSHNSNSSAHVRDQAPRISFKRLEQQLVVK